MDIISFFKQGQTPLADNDAINLASAWDVHLQNRGSDLASQEEKDGYEYIVLDGNIISKITSPEGHQICVGLHRGPAVITPNIARTSEGISLVSLSATSDALVAKMTVEELIERMIKSLPVRDWANIILQSELTRKAEREWCLAALKGADRLAWFRKRYPDYEHFFNHSTIASFLGMTPVTFSRLRTSA